MADAEAKRAVLAVEGVGKSFPGVLALDEVDFDVRAGEIHALLGQNGAGKSTLMNILAGILPHDSGRLKVNGEQTSIRSPTDAQALGISIVHQELSLFPNLSVAENIFVGRLPLRGGLVDQSRLVNQTRRALAALEMDVDPNAPVGDLPFSQQQLLEIAKALSFGGQVLILDEPTSALNEHESTVLFGHLRRLREAGMAIVYVSHRLREVFELSDRITVLRDGRLVGSFNASEVTQADVISMMVNQKVAAVAKPGASTSEKVALAVANLSVGGAVNGVDFELKAGEILGLAGLAGAGQSEIGRALSGLIPRQADSIVLNGSPFRGRSVHEAMDEGVVYLPADRRSEGLFLRLDVQQNISAASLASLQIGPWVRDGLARQVASGFVNSLGIRTPSLHQLVMNLSGGNQQKVVLARSLTVDALVFVADEPTRGIDVGAKAEIYGLLRSLAEEGKGVLLISTELPELLAISDRILVMFDGSITGELMAAEACEKKIMTLASGNHV